MDEIRTAPLTDQIPVRFEHDDEPKSSSAFPKFAVDAANSQVKRIAEILAAAADTIDELAMQNAASLPKSFANFSNSASSSLRRLADNATEEKAGELLEGLQRRAAENPVATAGIGAAIGTALGVALSRLNRA